MTLLPEFHFCTYSTFIWGVSPGKSEQSRVSPSQGSTLAVVNLPNTTGFSLLASEIPIVTSHVDYQHYGGEFLCQLQK